MSLSCHTITIFLLQIHINEVCHANGVKFFAADVFGFYGFMFADLGKHRYVEYVEYDRNDKLRDT